MKSLLLKDLLLLRSQTKSSLIILAMGLLFGISMNSSFVIGYMGFLFVILALSTLSYDEFENGNVFLFTLPFTRKQYVCEKYVFCLLALFAGVIVGTVFALPGVLIHKDVPEPFWDILSSAAVMVAGSLLMLCIMIPTRLRFGSENGRTISGFILGILVAAVIILLKVLLPEGASVSTPVHLPLIIILAVLFFAVVIIVSLAISLKVMENKEF